MKSFNRLCDAAASLMLAKRLEIMLNITMAIFTAALIVIAYFWVIHQVRSMSGM